MAFDPRTKEERKLFPFWTLIVIAGCAALWVFGAKIYQESMAAYQSYAAITQNVAQNTYYPGVTVDGVELGGMTREEAGALFGSRQQETSSAFSLVVQAGERKWRITSDEVPMTFDAQTVLDEAYNIGRYGTLEERLAAIDDAKTNGAAFTTGFSYDRTAIDRLVEIIADSLEYDATDATLAAFDVQTRTFTFSEAKPGYRVNRTALQEDILAALDEGAYDRVIVPKGEQVEPTITKSQLVGQFGLISSFTTTTTKDKDRNNNIEISAAALNGRMVKPGDTMSFNDCTGQRTGEKGYREAGAIACWWMTPAAACARRPPRCSTPWFARIWKSSSGARIAGRRPMSIRARTRPSTGRLWILFSATTGIIRCSSSRGMRTRR